MIDMVCLHLTENTSADRHSLSHNQQAGKFSWKSSRCILCIRACERQEYSTPQYYVKSLEVVVKKCYSGWEAVDITVDLPAVIASLGLASLVDRLSSSLLPLYRHVLHIETIYTCSQMIDLTSCGLGRVEFAAAHFHSLIVPPVLAFRASCGAQSTVMG